MKCLSSLASLARCGVTAGLMLTASNALAVEIMQWDRKPLVIDLPVGTERVITLDRNVRVGLPRAIADPETLRVQSAGGAIYLKADRPFDTQRVRIQDVETNEVILLDLTAKEEGASDEEIMVVATARGASQSADASSAPGEPGGAAEGEADAQSQSPRTGTPVPVVLTRYAAQSLYAPARTIEPVAGVSRVAMRLPDSVPSLLPSLPVLTRPLAAWQLEGWTVTAVRLTNRDPLRAFELDPRWLQGELYSASFMHPTIGPRGSVEDTTTVFVITRGQSLAQAVPLSQEEGAGRSISAEDGVRVGGGS